MRDCLTSRAVAKELDNRKLKTLLGPISNVVKTEPEERSSGGNGSDKQLGDMERDEESGECKETLRGKNVGGA